MVPIIVHHFQALRPTWAPQRLLDEVDNLDEAVHNDCGSAHDHEEDEDTDCDHIEDHGLAGVPGHRQEECLHFDVVTRRYKYSKLDI